jgi:hypothetical protein
MNNNKFGYRNNNQKYYYNNNGNGNNRNHMSYYTPYKIYNPVNLNMGKPIGTPTISASPILISNAADMGGIAAYHVSGSVMNLYNNQNGYPLNISSKDNNGYAIPNTGNICYSSANPPYMKVFYVASSQYANPMPYPKYQNMKSYNSTNNNNSNSNNKNNNNNNNNNNNMNYNNNNNNNNNNMNNKNNITTSSTTTTATTNSNNDINNSTTANTYNNINNKHYYPKSKLIHDTNSNYNNQNSPYKTYSSDDTVTNDVPTASSNRDNNQAYNVENK